jgi:class 3 adenylate cyclase
VLFDEIEKAHPDVLTLLLQILDEGTLTDARGRSASFREAVIVMTSNLVPEVVKAASPIGFGRQADTTSAAADSLREGLRGQLRPEILGRIGAVVGFNSLGEREFEQIVDKLIADWSERLAGRVTVPPGLRARILGRAGSRFGARELQRVVEEELGELLKAPVALSAPAHNGVIVDDLPLGGRGETAMLVLDIVQSTQLIHALGDTVFSKVVGNLGEQLRKHPSAPAVRYLKSIGDGVLVLFNDMAAAFEVARTFELSAHPSAKVRRVLHWGRIKRGHEGDPLGVEVHRVFRVEKVAEEDRVGDGAPLPKDPGKPLLTASARERLPEALRQSLTRIGEFRLRGFPDPVELWTTSH